MKRIAIFGATSAIAQALSRRYAGDGAQFVLLGRNAARLEAVAADLRVRGALRVDIEVVDLDDVDAHEAAVARCVATLAGLDLCVVAYGSLSDQAASIANPWKTSAELHVNFVSAAALLTQIANILEAQGSGAIVVLGSVAGDRGRRTNYVYGSAKAGLNAFTEGLRHRLRGRGVDVLLVKPGFVDTPMTAGIEKQGPLWATPERVARDIQRALEKGAPVVYTPWFWRPIMLVIRALPDAIFQRLSI
jgi:decaprenylphospho-beta-D-erythro-pentofuranosid-2-ulose 2-reductase